MIVVDVETTGLDPHRNSIVSIGAVEFENPANQFYQECKVRSCSEISDGALKINGFTRKEVADIRKPTLIETMHNFLDWSGECREQTLAGHNISFDRGFLEESLKHANAGNDKARIWPFGYRTIDAHTICYASHLMHGIMPPLKDGKSNINLDVALAYVGMPSEPKPHNALTGAKVTAELLSRLVWGKVLFPEYSQYAIPGFL